MKLDACLDTDICVVGGGPAGSTIARQLALLNYRVILIERKPFPRAHVGESFPPSIVPILKHLGLIERVEAAGFLRPSGALVLWGGGKETPMKQFNAPGFQVDRGKFDSILLDAAREAGVSVKQPATAVGCSRVEPGCWRLEIQVDRGRTHHVTTGFIVDAAARRSLLRSRKVLSSVSTLALYAYWNGTGLEGASTRVEAGADQWYWGAPLPSGSFNATVFVDPKRCSRMGRQDLWAYYTSLLGKSTLLGDCLKGRPETPVLACDASARYDPNPVADTWIKVGDAAFTIDPLSSQGVQTAIRSGMQGAAVVHTLLALPENKAAAVEYYERQQADTVSWHASIAARHYWEAARTFGGTFWTKRSREPNVSEEPARSVQLPFSPDQRIALSSHARILEAPAVQGSIIVRVPAVSHPNLKRTVAFLGGRRVGALLPSLLTRPRIKDILQCRIADIPPSECEQMLRWLWDRGILVPYFCSESGMSDV